MLICLDQRTGTGCNVENHNHAQFCKRCGKSLRFALHLHDPGTLVGRYRIEGVLGHGGFGAVYAAEDTRQSALHPQGGMIKVALKETFDADSIRSFRREFAILSGLHHAHLPRYYEMFEDQGNGYLVMELVPGQSLQDVLEKQQGPLLEVLVLGYALQVCDALSYLHGQNPPILHRDIKPDNIRLTPEGLIKLVDFGLLKQGIGPTQSSRRALTPPYAPLEQWGGGTTPRSDLYSLGATLYHLLTGHVPTEAPNRMATKPDPLKPPQQLNPHISPQMAEVIMRAMALQQPDRYASAIPMRQALLGKVPTPQGVPSTLIVSQTGRGQYKTISEAIKNALAGSRIVVQPGHYTESLVIDKPLQISGHGLAKDIIIESSHAPCLRMQTDQALVRGLTLRGRGKRQGIRFFAVEIPQGELVLEGCDITSDTLSSVAIYGSATNPIIRQCHIHDSQEGGLFIWENATGILEECDIFGNTFAGIEIKQGANPVIRRCKIHDGREVGVYIRQKGQGTLENCHIYGNTLAGVVITQSATPIVRECHINQNGYWGIWAYNKGAGRVENCDLTDNKRGAWRIDHGWFSKSTVQKSGNREE